ncbi:hypothetical protein JCM9279_003140 [Rhodotorula babjevae]
MMPHTLDHATQGSLTPQPDSALALPEVHELACFRTSPRPCPNQGLVDQLKPLREWRFLLHGTDDKQAISYATATSVIIGTPFVITSAAQARALPKIGPKLVIKIQEYLDKGFIQEARDVQQLERFKVLRLLTTVHGVGHALANKLYDDGARTLDDLQVMLKDRLDIMSYMRFYANLQEPVPRSEVESVRDFVRLQIDKVLPGAHLELCGGYRRGKATSGDIDVLITFPHQDGLERGVLRRLVNRLVKKGLVPRDGGVLSLTEAGSSRTTWANRRASLGDTLDKALVVFKHPANGTTRPRDTWRRVDLVVAAWPFWGPAVLGWTGSTQFERDLRRHANKLGYTFDSGGIRSKETDEHVEARTERDCFRLLGLEWIPPHLRNADP